MRATHPLSVMLGVSLGLAVIMPVFAAESPAVAVEKVSAEGATESPAMVMETASVEDTVTRRVLERWNLLMEGRVESAYAYLSPGYREVHSLARYSRKVQGVGLWKGAKVQEIQCADKRCDVKVVLDLSIGGAKPVPAPVEEAWIQLEDGGEWWYVPSY